MPYTSILNLVLLLLSWLLFFAVEKRNVFREWLTPVLKRLRELAIGFLFAAFLCVVSQLTLSQISGVTWSVADGVSTGSILSAAFYDFNSVLFEELLFRGVILYFLIRYLGEKKGILVSAAAFGVYHWFTAGVLGNPFAMLLVFSVTGLMGYALAVAFSKTRSVVLPFALHFGWNLVNHLIFSNGPNGVQLLEPSHAAELSGSYAFISFGLYLLVPLLFWLFIRSKAIRRTDNIPQGA